MWKTIVSLLAKGGAKAVSAIAKSGKYLSKTGKAALNYGVPKVSSVIKQGGKIAAGYTKNPVGKASINAATKLLASEKLLRTVAKDLAYKTVSAGVKKIPKVGKVVAPILDAGDTFIGIPLI